jgi:GWxTD domain-containing protein
MVKGRFFGRMVMVLTVLAMGANGNAAAVRAQAELDAASFVNTVRMQAESGPYVEVQVSWPGAQGFVEASFQASGQYAKSMELVIIASQGEEVVAFAKTTMVSPAFATEEEANAARNVHIERLNLPPGRYQVETSVGGQTVTEGLEVVAADRPLFSDPFFVQAYAATDAAAPTMLSRSGLDILPTVGSIIDRDAPSVRFYAELYGLQHVPDSMFLLVAEFVDATGNPIAGTTRYFRKRLEPTVPLFEAIPWPADSAHRTSVAILSLRAETRNREPIASIEIPAPVGASLDRPFPDRYRWSEAVGEALWRDSVALLAHLGLHVPRATASQRHTIQNTLGGVSQAMLQGFLMAFWEQHTPEAPLSGWADYTERIAEAEELFGGCRMQRLTDQDMGYAYLRYGKPNTVVRRHNETEYFPYEIWHYYQAEGLSDKRFLFYSPHAVAECFALLHSNMPGETQNHDWLTILKTRENSLRVTDSQMNRLNARDTYSREEPEDLFFNPR